MDENRTYKIELEIEAPDYESADELVEKMFRNLSEKEILRINCGDLEDVDRKRFVERIRYVEDWCGQGEHFVFEGKWTDEDEWSLDSAFQIIDDRLSYQAVTKIRELMKLGTEFWFSKQ